MNISIFLYLIQHKKMINSSGKISPKIESSWKKTLSREFETEQFLALKEYLIEEKSTNVIYPPSNRIFEAFNQTPFENVKCVILGQDPYHGQNQAHGLCFSVQDGVRPPPSLVNIFKELNADLGLDFPSNGNLSKWANQGVFLLNATLTVRANQAGSHQGKGWEEFTDNAIIKLSEEKENLVFILWGKFAQAKAGLIDPTRHLILMAAHPSPFSAYKGFLGCKHFSKTNDYLKKHGIEPIDWDLNN